MIQSDFARLETDTKAAEAEAQRQFDEFTSESAVNRASMTKDVDIRVYLTRDRDDGRYSLNLGLLVVLGCIDANFCVSRLFGTRLPIFTKCFGSSEADFQQILSPPDYKP